MHSKESDFSVGLKVLIVVAILMVISIAVVSFSYIFSIGAVDKNNNEMKVIEIKNGQGVTGIADLLKENNLIKWDFSFKVFCKLNKVKNLQAGIYELSPSMNVEQITKKLQAGEVIKRDITVMFPEGKNMRAIAKIIQNNTNHTYDEVMSVFEDKEYAKKLIQKYWFLTDEILENDIYYPLEGYLLPETYIFESVDVSIEDIIEKMLNQSDKILSKYKDKIREKGYTIHQFLSLTSVVENEGMSTEDRYGIAGVFLNRIKNGIALESDSTTYYAFKIDMGERDLTLKELNTYNKYNTRGPKMGGKAPAGPISNVSEESIQATLNPTHTDDLFFVSDKNGKVYFTKTNAEHEEMIKKLRKQGLWYTFD